MIYILFVLFIACGKPANIDPTFMSYNNQYFKLSNAYGIVPQYSVDIYFASLPKDTLAECNTDSNVRQIEVSDAWQDLTPLEREMLFDHEATHCYCNRKHTFFQNNTEIPYDTVEQVSTLASKGFLPDGCPQSIMYPYLVSNECAERHHTEYIFEMFKGCNPT